MTDAFDALADPTRRKVLERLHTDNGQSVTELNHGFTISRQAMTKHLAVLESARLVVVKRVGREKLHFINTPALLRVVARWLLRFKSPAQEHDTAATRAGPATTEKERRAPRKRTDRRPDHMSKPDRARKEARLLEEEDKWQRERAMFEDFKRTGVVPPFKPPGRKR